MPDEILSSQSDVSPDHLGSPSGSGSGRLASYPALFMAILSQSTALFLVGSTWNATLATWIESDRWGPHAANAGVLLSLACPTAFALAMRLAAKAIERRR